MKQAPLYSLQQIAIKLDIPQSTVAYYRKNYADFMPSTRLKGKRYPLYEEQAVEVVSLIRELSERGKEQHEILLELESKYPPVIDRSGENTTNEQQTNQQPTTMLATTQKQGEIISSLISQQTQLIQAQNATLEGYKFQTQELTELVEALQQERENLRVKLAEAEAQTKQHEPAKESAKAESKRKATTRHKRKPKPKTTPPKQPASPKKQGVWSRLFN